MCKWLHNVICRSELESISHALRISSCSNYENIHFRAARQLLKSRKKFKAMLVGEIEIEKHEIWFVRKDKFVCTGTRMCIPVDTNTCHSGNVCRVNVGNTKIIFDN